MLADVLLTNALAIACLMLTAWVISIPLRDVSFIDSVWGLGFVVVAWTSYVTSGGHDRALLIALLTSLWGLRLAGYLFSRWRREGPDKRYVKIIGDRKNRHLFTLWFVFGIQGVMMWIVSLPVQVGAGAIPTDIGILAGIGAALTLTGTIIEATADAQMAAFKADPANEGQVMDKGLWRYSRHPNYFGDACVWWGLFLIAAEAGPWFYALPGALLITWTLMKWSGVPLLERNLKKSRPAYADYAARTNAFIPGPPKAKAGDS